MAANDVNGSRALFRAHLSLRVEWSASVDAKSDRLCRLIAEQPWGGVIVFVDTPDTAQRLHGVLSAHARTALTHPNQDAAVRHAERQRFVSGEAAVLVATPQQHELGRLDVRLVIHHDWPATLDTYHRQVMEGARDGQPGTAVLLACTDDKVFHRRHRPQGLERMIAFGQAQACRWQGLLEHLGEEVAFTRCGACDYCERLDAATEEAVRGTIASVVTSNAVTGHDWPAPATPGERRQAWPLRQGLAVAVHRHGWGWVQQVEESLVSVDFPDGHSGRFTPERVHPLSSHALDFVARLLPAQVSALRQHEDDHLDIAMTYHQLLNIDRSATPSQQPTGMLLGPSDSSDSGSDVACWADGHLAADHDLDQQDFGTDSNGTGERWGVGVLHAREAFDILPDRIDDQPDDGFADL